jgi:hypothetical protein
MKFGQTTQELVRTGIHADFYIFPPQVQGGINISPLNELGFVVK